MPCGFRLKQKGLNRAFGPAFAVALAATLVAGGARASRGAVGGHVHGALRSADDSGESSADASIDVGACAASVQRLVRNEHAVVIYRDSKDRLRAGVPGAKAGTAVAKTRGEGRFRIESDGVRLETTGRRLARVDGQPYLIFDARAAAAALGPTSVALACRLSADRLRPDPEPTRQPPLDRVRSRARKVAARAPNLES